MKGVSLASQVVMGLLLIAAGCTVMIGCSDKPVVPASVITPVTSTIDPPITPTAQDLNDAVIKPINPSASDVKFSKMVVGTSVVTSMEHLTGGEPQVIVTINDPAAPGGTQTSPLTLTQKSPNGNILVDQTVILPPGDALLTLEPNTRVYFGDVTALPQQRALFGQYVTLSGLEIRFTVNHAVDNQVSWTMPTSYDLLLRKLDTGEYILKGSKLAVYFDRRTSLPPQPGTFNATVECYGPSGNLKATVHQVGTIDRYGYGYIIPRSSVSFTTFKVYLDFRN